jgi:hypothetical protein
MSCNCFKHLLFFLVSITSFYSCSKDNVPEENKDDESTSITTYYLSLEANYSTESGTYYPIVCDVSVFDQSSKSRIDRGTVINGWYANPFTLYSSNDVIRIELWNQTNYCFEYKENISPKTTPNYFVTSKDDLTKNKQSLPHFRIPQNELHNVMYGVWGP